PCGLPWPNYPVLRRSIPLLVPPMPGGFSFSARGHLMSEGIDRVWRYKPIAEHWLNGSGCPLCAKSRHSALRHRPALFDHFVGATEQRGRYSDPKSLGSGQIDGEV